MEVVAGAQTVVGIHGCRNGEGADLILLGGLDHRLLKIVQGHLIRAGCRCLASGHKFPATNRFNICNRGKSGRGVQIELPWDMRQSFLKTPQERKEFIGAIQAALVEYQVPT
ncbi:hypothetical protein DOO74_18355 [Rhodobacteraceae bacterium AsT-22]|nr:hypothetical protein DOO74_18355 [Rhodobacteraceae bacterium AsT-22]